MFPDGFIPGTSGGGTGGGGPTIPSPSTGQVQGQLYAYDFDATVVAGVRFQFLLRATNGSPARSFPADPSNTKTVTSDSSGLVAVNLLQNSTYWGRRELAPSGSNKWGRWVQFATGEDTPYPVPEILGMPSV